MPEQSSNSERNQRTPGACESRRKNHGTDRGSMDAHCYHHVVDGDAEKHCEDEEDGSASHWSTRQTRQPWPNPTGSRNSIQPCALRPSEWKANPKMSSCTTPAMMPASSAVFT